MSHSLFLLQIFPSGFFESDIVNFLFFSFVGCLLLYAVYYRRRKSGGALEKDPLGQHVVYKYGFYELQGRRPYMEDRYDVRGEISGDPAKTMYAVFDGHGGSNASEFCTEAVYRNIVTSGLLEKSTKRALRTALLHTDDEYLRLANRNNKDDGTTAIVVYVNGRDITCTNVGDSRAILVLRNGGAIPLSIDHKPNRKDERERIEALGGSVSLWGVWRVEGCLAVSRAIGDRMLKDYVSAEPEILERTITKDDAFIIVATDGLWDVLSNQTVAQISCTVAKRSERGVQEVAEALAQDAYAKGSTDNISVIVLDLREPPNIVKSN